MELYKIDQLIVGDIQTNCWIVQYGDAGNTARSCARSCARMSGRRSALIDPGDEAQVIIAHLESLSLRPAYILLTHGHFDHIGAVPAVHAAYPEAIIALHPADAPRLGPAVKTLGLKDGDAIGPFTVLHTPGHTPGCVVFLHEGQKIMFSGDTLFQGDCGRVDLPGGDQASIEASLKRLLALDSGIQVLPGHGPATTIAAEQGTRFF